MKYNSNEKELIDVNCYFDINSLIINFMQSITSLYEKTKQSLHKTNNNDPDSAIEIIKEVRRQLQYLRLSDEHLENEINKLEMIALNNLACAYRKYF